LLLWEASAAARRRLFNAGMETGRDNPTQPRYKRGQSDMIAMREDPRAEYRRLLALVLDKPGLDGPRLHLANWLERTGHDPIMADFIRVDIAYWRAITDYSPSLSQDSRTKSIAALGERRQLLLDGHGKRWCEPLNKIVQAEQNISFHTRRGLIGSIIVAGGEAAQRLAVRGDKLLSLAPIESLCLGSDQESDHESFDVSGHLTILALTRTKLFSVLRSLELSGNWIGAAGAAALLEVVPPPRLRFLRLRPRDISLKLEQELRQRYRRCFISFECEMP